MTAPAGHETRAASAPDGAPPAHRATSAPPVRWRRVPVSRRARMAMTAAALLVLVTAPLWGPPLLARMSFFRVRRVEIDGLRYISPSDILARLRVDTTASVWDDPAPLEARVATHPQVRAVRITRRLPGTLVVRITEDLPVALVPAGAGFLVLDAEGKVLPIDPTRTQVDLPIVARRDTATLRLLAETRAALPALYDRISEVRPGATSGTIVLRLTTVPVLAMSDVSIDRLAELAAVESDLARRGLRPAALDLRFRDQVIARLP